MNYYKHHIGDYDADTSHLTWLEDAAYRRLMCLYYRREQPVPEPIDQACRLVRAASKAEREAVATVLNEFFQLTESGWVHKRCEEELIAYKGKESANRANGAKGGRPKRKVTEEKPSGLSVGSEEEPTNNLNQEPLTKNQEPVVGETAPTARPRGTRLPPGWAPDSDLEGWAKQERPDLDLSTTVETFRDYWVAQPGTRGTKLDWPATFRNWVRSQRAGAAVKKPFDLEAWARDET